MKTQSLNGAWQFKQQNSDAWLPATVPGCVHTDLMAAGEIPDPYYRDNEKSLQWIGEKVWTYTLKFVADTDLLGQPLVLLQCKGLDTLAEITLNGEVIGKTNNQFRLWEFDVTEVLKPGENEITVRFDSALLYGQEKLAERYIHSWSTDEHKVAGGNYVRKSQCNFGWDWGPQLITCGIWRDITLVGLTVGRLDDVLVEQIHSDDGSVSLMVDIAAEALAEDTAYDATLTVSLDGNEVITAETSLEAGLGAIAVTIPDPELWWPNGLGSQPLYTVTVTLKHAGEVVDHWERQIGLRTLKLITQPDEWGESFHFECNGVPFFSKGANWIPADTFIVSIGDDHYEDLLQSAVDANMNMLRVWGGGIYEQPIFYELCDKLGICVWQDFMFACATYPTFDPAFMENVETEARQVIKELRHHASMALWCGNNELEQGLVDDEWTATAMSWQDYAKLYDHLLRDLVQELDPHTDYWPGSPHSPYGSRLDWNNPNWGDAHIWDVWHGNKPFEFYRTCMHRFNSEFGFQSLPEPATLETVLAAEDKNLTSYVMELHQRSPVGNSKIMTYMLEWFQLPNSFENTAWLSQIQQGMAIKYAVEHWRRTMPRGMGTLYWQLNDCWPVASWSSLDSLGKWKGLHYMAKHFFAPMLLSAVEDLDAQTITLHVTHDVPDSREGIVSWQIITANKGDVVQAGKMDCQFQGPASLEVGTIDLADALAKHDVRNLLVRMWLEVSDEMVSTNLVHLSRPKHVMLADPELKCSISKSGDTAVITINAARPAMWAWLEFDGSAHGLSDNFFHLFPGDEEVVTFKTKLSAAELNDQLKISSLWDTFSTR